MRKKKVTMTDIATAAGVSQPTVSVILNGSDAVKIADDTRERVLAVAAALGYELRKTVHQGHRHKKIAFLVNSMNMHDPFINAVSAAREAAWQQDHILVVLDYEEESDLLQTLTQEIALGDYSALIYAHNMAKENLPLAIRRALPTVMLNCFPPADCALPAVMAADEVGAYRMTRHLLDRGYRRIAFINGEPWSEPARLREQGYRRALQSLDIAVETDLIRAGNWSIRQSFLQTQALLALNPRPDAIFCASDLMAVGCYQALAAAGLSIPQDMAVAGYDNQLLASELTPTLTSIDLPYDDMGRVAVEMVTGMRGADGGARIWIEGDLVERASTGGTA